MPKVAIITDTDSSLPLEITKEQNIIQVPIIIQFGDSSYKDVYDIDDMNTFKKVDKEGKIPTTAAPSPGQFFEAYKKAFDSGADSIICFTISSEMSAVYSSARNATEMFPGKDINVVDTRTLSMGQGFMVLAAAEAISQGATVDEAIAAAVDVRNRTYLYAALSTLKYLAMSGRVGHLAAGIATVLDVRPILTIIDGKLQLLERVRTQAKSWGRVIELSADSIKGQKVERCAFLHVNAHEDLMKFETQMRSTISLPEKVIYAEMNPGLSVHTGAGTVVAVLVLAG